MGRTPRRTPTKEELDKWEQLLAGDGLAAIPDEQPDEGEPPTEFEVGLGSASAPADEEESEILELGADLPDGMDGEDELVDEHEGDLHAYIIVDEG